MKKVPDSYCMKKFLLLYRVPLSENALESTIGKLDLDEKLLDFNRDQLSILVPELLEKLERGLGDRIYLTQPKYPSVPKVHIGF